jgi:hypothetical protein
MSFPGNIVSRKDIFFQMLFSDFLNVECVTFMKCRDKALIVPDKELKTPNI